MKKVLIALTICAVMMSVAAYAGQSNTGCGLGSIIFGEKNGLLSQTCAAIFNGSFFSQTFGITTGTSNCSGFSGIVSNEQINRFVADNMDSLAKDIAKGNGEYLNTLAVLMEVKESDRAGVYSKLQSNFSKIYSSDKITHIDVIKNIESVLKAS